MRKGSVSNIGTVVGSTSPSEFQFHLKNFTAKLGDLVTVQVEIPSEEGNARQEVLVWGRITELQRFNPFLPAEATVELADEGLDLTDTVLSNTRDQVEGTVLVLGRTPLGDFRKLVPLNYPVQPGAIVRLPPPEDIKTILVGDSNDAHRMHVGTLIGRSDVPVSLRTNMVVARHMAILAMTGGGKTVAARRILRELLEIRYPLVILDPHGDYLGFWEKQNLFPKNKIKLFYPDIRINSRNRDVVSYLVSQMTQGFTDPQREVFSQTSENVHVGEDEEISISAYLDRLMTGLANQQARHPGTIPAVRRGLRMVMAKMDAMRASNQNLRSRLREYPFEAMPDPRTSPEKYVQPGQASIIYLGGYDHLTQSTIVSLILQNLFEERASMRNNIPPFLTVVEEAHNFIPSKGEGQAETPSVEIIRRVITEGRKFGVGLMLVSQRPSRLDETTLSQCNNFLILRLVNPRDQQFVEKVMENMSRADSRLLPAFGPGEGIVSGQAVRFPLVVRIKFDDDLVTSTIGDEDFVKAVQAWEGSSHGEAHARSEELEEALKSVGTGNRKK
ncbi:MAG TPA: ATP-binding protein [Terriglobia bacterium]|nr:ATP-binding protein [Terriglobia bacterium]